MVNNIGKFLTLSSWNINGLEFKNNGIKSNKIHDPKVINTLKTFDFIGLMETHANPDIFYCKVIRVFVKIVLNTRKVRR